MVVLDRDAVRAFSREVTMFLPDLVQLLRRVVADPRVPQSAKVEAAAALAYLVSPKNRLTNAIPVVGQLDDVAVIAFAFRRLAVGAGEPILREHWRGSDRGFQLLIGASSALASPAGAVRKAKLARSLVMAGFERVGGRVRWTGERFGAGTGGRTTASSAGPAADDRPRIVDGEVVDRGEWVAGPPAGDTPGSGSRTRRDRFRASGRPARGR
ncbi:hypothetical protein CcI156_14005 [Frankia sp. CcI156]|uniref:DUF1232 domain-containing protein n=1 Tax=Frankia casuarinae (strain DSM 45818 / CECT 9043 / HFP020203 / CcI3) TaxID=106370 RepID=Q2J6P7_FRACC|nr:MULTISPECIES: DUF1232 domain-containing protein [Frankia]ABD13045.1 hypothetical protein Francci3_3693 [Frankia casuarinae]ETA01776.1 hypothetical protein CcI6DRAFT_02787 [Frankia sp. CcI6]EYT92446.1 hypothetical protein ThrDRAFT_01895 [Frankia casuarinae]KDA42273.1 hypothetical protein BMG523Draft_02903 [Frankia sp. BMG5.23]KEZ35181.1 hypothetical protein CEDDRAFT_03433 [Frankia sp. CeD]